MFRGQVAIVTGANRGIGLEVCRQLAKRNYSVILGSRDLAKGERAATQLNTKQVIPRQLDVSDPASIGRLREWVASEFGVLDVLVNNAAIHYDTWQRAVNADLAIVQEAIETNVYGPWRMAQAFLPLLRKSQHGRIVNVSSEAGSLASMGGGTPAYSLTKAALNTLTRMLAAELHRRTGNAAEKCLKLGFAPRPHMLREDDGDGRVIRRIDLNCHT